METGRNSMQNCGNFTSGADLKAMSGDADDVDTGVDMRARSKEDPEIHWKGL